MPIKHTNSYSVFPCRIWPILLAGCWILGLLAGNLSLFFHDHFSCVLGNTDPFSVVPVSDLMVPVMAPILISVILSRFRRVWLLLLVFFKGFSGSFSSAVICLSVQHGGWFLRLIWMFGSVLTLPLLYWYWLRAYDGRSRPFRAIAVVISGVLICIAEHKLILPVLI